MATSLRAVVMLSVLVGLPAVWLYYGPLPKNAQRVVDQFVAASKEAVGWDKRRPQQAASQKAVAEAPSFAGGASAAVRDPFGLAATAPQSIASPKEEPAAPPLLSPKPTEPADPQSALAGQLEPLLVKLRQLGVAEYALERWGEAGQLYRFHCEMPLAASDQLTQEFEAIAGTPQASVEQVVSEVGVWRLARQGETTLR